MISANASRLQEARRRTSDFGPIESGYPTVSEETSTHGADETTDGVGGEDAVHTLVSKRAGTRK